jgi:hypothetical protein
MLVEGLLPGTQITAGRDGNGSSTGTRSLEQETASGPPSFWMLHS